MNIESKLEGYENFLKSFATGTEYSALWDKYRKDFTVSANSTSKARQRGYGINCEGDTRSSLYISVFTRANYIFTRLSMLLSKLVANLLSLMLFGNFDTKTKYGFDYPIDVRKAIRAQDPELLDAYTKKNSELGWSYSHNSFKSFFHYYTLNKYKSVKEFEGKKCLEIGSGLCNYAMILTSELENFSYVCVDIPEMIPSGAASIYHNAKGNFDIFLPHEIEEFLSSESKKKYLFILPSQLINLPMKFNLFTNHESFSEMSINTVNTYLDQVSKKMVTGGVINLVNRYLRLTGKDRYDLSQYTKFEEYDLSNFEKIHMEVDRFRDVLPGMYLERNIAYIGKTN